MDRRKFLKGVSGAAVAAVIPISDRDGVSLRSMAHPIGKPAPLDVASEALEHIAGPTTIGSNMKKALWPGVDKWFGEKYAESLNVKRNRQMRKLVDETNI